MLDVRSTVWWWFFFFKQKTAYEMRISDWSSDVCSSDLLSRFGTVSLDGTKIHANASRHSALSYGHAQKIEAQLKAEVQELLALAEAADQSTLPDGVNQIGRAHV